MMVAIERVPSPHRVYMCLPLQKENGVSLFGENLQSGQGIFGGFIC